MMKYIPGDKGKQFGRIIAYIKELYKRDSRYAVVLSLIFVIPSIILALRHEMWRDEMNVWLIARDLSSPFEIIQHLRYDGHPGLWHLCVFALRHFLPYPIAMQMLHLAIATMTVYLFVRFSPFTKLQKALFIFGYFSFYEYNIIVRNYALGVFLIFLICTLFPKRFALFPLVGFILFLLAHTSIHALIIVISIGLVLSIEYITSAKKRKKTNKLKIGIGFSLIALGIVTSIIQIKPPPDYGFAVGWMTKFDPKHLQDTLSLVSRAFIPIPQFTFSFWGINILDKLSSAMTVHLVLSCLILLWGMLLLAKKPLALLMYISGTIGLLAFFYIKYSGSMRHWGFLFVMLLASIWMGKYLREKEHNKGPFAVISSALQRHQNKVLIVILTIHLIGGVVAAQFDYRYIFSQAKATAEFIKKEKLDDLFIAGDEYTGVAPISGYLGQRIYYPRVQRMGSFWILKEGWLPNISVDEILVDIEKFKKKDGRDVLLILNYPLDNQKLEKYSLKKVSEFLPAIVGYEQYYLYLDRKVYNEKKL
ncbi:MAG: hypothetical protein AAB116_23930 [Candidatus Poribacteria bacterium]